MENIKIEKEEVEQSKGNEQFKRGLIIVGAVGAVCGIYGLKVGFRLGYERGAKDGIIHAGNMWADALNNFTKELKETKGE